MTHFTGPRPGPQKSKHKHSSKEKSQEERNLKSSGIQSRGCWGLPGGAVVKGAVLGSRPGSVVTGRDREVRGATHNWPSVVRVREGLVGRDLLVSSRTSDSCGGPGAVCASQGCQEHGVASDTLVRLGWMRAVLRSSAAGWVVYRRTHDIQPSSLPSPYGSCSNETR